MTEKTSKKIKEYQSALPIAREKIMMAVTMLLVAAIVMVTTTYAWINLSRAPVVSNISLTMAANGALEIGLAGKDGSQPEEFDIDEGLANVFETDVMLTNRLWGNIINLSDPSYGFEKLILRPAQLDVSKIEKNPLKGVAYGNDGRVEILNTDFIYSAYSQADNNFVYSKDKGVRAISSYAEMVLDSAEQKKKDLGKIVEAKQNAVNTYYKANVPAKLAALSDMISTYAQEKVNGTEYAPSGATVPLYFTKAHIQSAKGLYDALYNAMELQKEAYIALANYQMYLAKGNDYYEANKIESFDIFYNNPGKYNANSASENFVESESVIKLYGLTTFVNDYKTLVDDREHFRKYIEDEWKDSYYSFSTGGDSGYTINYMIARLIDYSNMYLVYNGKNYKVTELQSLGTGLLDLNGKTYPCYIVNGIMKRFEQSCIQSTSRLPNQANSTKKASIKIAMKVKKIITINFSVNGETHTTAEGDSYFNANYAFAQNANAVDKDYVAVDTYGMAIDFWVRCNAEETCLTLAGATATTETGEVIRYDGINRVWGSTGDATLSTSSTTQGGGSCYVYYADTPEDEKASKDLLQSMKVAFVRTSLGEVLAYAEMDTSNAWNCNGRITVPMVISDTAEATKYYFVDETNATQRGLAITTLYIDEPRDITAIVYLDGESLENTHVLAVSDIEGQLNIQFGSSTELITVGDNDLITATRSVTASASKTTMDYDSAMTVADLTTTVTAYVDGVDPVTMEAFFQRAINESQGQREEKKAFTKQADGSWKADYTFTAPGEYYMRYIRVNGVDYALENPVQVTVTGLIIEYVNWQEADPKEHSVFQTAPSYKEHIDLKYATNDQSKLPKKVSATFENDDGTTITTELTNKNNVWSGDFSFQSSGKYTLKYLVQDGKYVDLAYANNGAKDFTKTLDLTLGITVAVYDKGGDNSQVKPEQYDPDHQVDTYYKEVFVRIFDNAGNMLVPESLDEYDKPVAGPLAGRTTYLKYSPLTTDTDLVWDPEAQFNGEKGCYKGTLQITSAGRYTFNYLRLGEDTLTNAITSPVYTILPPDPPTYLPAVKSDYATLSGNVQFAPFTNDAYLGPIGLKYAESADVTAYVKNSITGEIVKCDMANVEGAKGKIYYAGNDQWYINLPTYIPAEGEPATQEGIWTLEAITLSNCYDSASKLLDEANPMVFASRQPSKAEFEQIYGREVDGFSFVSADLAQHSTDVSCSVVVLMNPGTTEHGDSSTPFMKLYHVNTFGMSLTIKDAKGRTIPSTKIANVGLNWKYNSDDTLSTNYGYKVNGVNSDNTVLFSYNSTSGNWTQSNDFIIRYVGPYKVQNLTVEFGKGNKYVVSPDNCGVPAQHVVRSAAPSASNGLTPSITSGSTTFNGFLSKFDVGTTVKLNLSYIDENGIEQNETHVSFEGDINVSVKYKYNESSKPSWLDLNGNSDYKDITIAGTLSNGKYSFASTVLYPGTYTQTIVVGTVEYAQNSLTVTAAQPELKVTAVNPASGTYVKINKANDLSEWSSSSLTGNLVSNKYKNTLSSDGYSATVYIAADQYTYSGYGTKYYVYTYTLPKVSVKLSGLSGASYSSVKCAPKETGDYKNEFNFTSNNQINDIEVGEIDSTRKTAQRCDGYDLYTRHEALTQTFETITVTFNGKNYILTLSHSVTISEPRPTS